MTKDEALKLALEALENNRQTHHYCEDTWYSCPKHEDGCANDAEGDKCNCGADKANAEIDATITAIKEALANVATNDTSQECVDKTSEIVHEPEYLAFMDTPQRKPLTRKEVLAIIDKHPAEKKTGLPMFYRDQVLNIARAIEAAHGIKEKNT